LVFADVSNVVQKMDELIIQLTLIINE
jgi:hypothetical protein